MGWLKAVWKGIVWVSKNQAVREVVLSVVAQKIAEKKHDEAARALGVASRNLDTARRELDEAPKVRVE